MNAVADLRGASGTHAPWGPNSFIVMQFSAKTLVSTPIFGVGAPLRKILDPPLECNNVCQKLQKMDENLGEGYVRVCMYACVYVSVSECI